MNYEKFPIYNMSNYNAHFSDIKNWFDENTSNFFSKIVVNESNETYGRTASIDFYDSINGEDVIVHTLYVEDSGGGNSDINHIRLRVKSYINNGSNTIISSISKNMTSIANADIPTYGIPSASPEYFNAVLEIVKMRETVIGLTLTNSASIGLNKLTSVLIFAKTHNGRVALIRPSINFSKEGICKNYWYNDTTSDCLNYISTLTYETIPNNTRLHYLYGRDGQSITSFMKLPVSGCEDYIPNVYYLPSSSTRIKPNSDCVLHIGYFEYYYNGVIAVELIS